MFELRYLSRQEREQYDQLFFDATHDEFGNTVPTRDIGARLRAALEGLLGSGLQWPKWLLDDITEEGLKRRGAKWLKQSVIVSVNGGDSVVVKKHAYMGILRSLKGGSKGYQQVLWSDMTTRELLQVISTSAKRRKTEAYTIATARRLLELCEKHSCVVVSKALDLEGVTLDEFLCGAA